MGKYIIKRVLWMIPTLLGVVFIIFVINELTPGDAALMSLGTNYTEEAYAAKVVELGLDKPVMIRFVQYVKNIICGFNLGTSYSTLRSVRTMLMERIGVTVQIGILGSMITILIGVSVGIISAIKQYSALDYVVTTISILLSALPGFFLALVFVMLFSLKLG
ncbi:MAG: ABC transporter permease [Oscillospiraceae bacterium]|nr:ABC transporter permease [Oscillospiraceae bacterium]